MEKIYHANTNQKVGVAILIPDKADFKTRKIMKDKERYYIIIEGSILQEYVKNIIHAYT